MSCNHAAQMLGTNVFHPAGKPRIDKGGSSNERRGKKITGQRKKTSGKKTRTKKKGGETLIPVDERRKNLINGPPGDRVGPLSALKKLTLRGRGEKRENLPATRQ